MKTRADNVRSILSPRQIEVLSTYYDDNWRVRVSDGAIRSGKTFANNISFLMELKRVRKLADDRGVDTPMYILAGVSSKTIQNNVLQSLSNTFGLEFKFDKHNSFTLFGVKVIQAFTGSIAGLGSIRGMDAFGAYVNEASLANEEVWKEIRRRIVFVDEARIIADTNPDNPQHWLKRDYIDPADNGTINVHFRIDDNTAMSPQAIANIKNDTMSGMPYDRDILGLWVTGEGAIYRDFDEKYNVIDYDDIPEIDHYSAGVDWGYGHKGAIVVVGHGADGNSYIVDEYAEAGQEIDFWTAKAKEFEAKYGKMVFWCDSARVEHIDHFMDNGLDARYADKNVDDGIEFMGSLIKKRNLIATRKKNDPQHLNEFFTEIYNYVWDEKTGKPVKENDDVMDATRYELYNELNDFNKLETTDFGGMF